MNAAKLDLKVLVGAGSALLLLSGIFLWRDLELPAEAMVAVSAVLASVLALGRYPKDMPLVGPLALLSVTAVGAVWYALTKQPLMLPALGVCVTSALVTVIRTNAEAREASHRVHLLLLWHGLALSVLVTTAAFYFHFFTLGFAQDDLARRLVLTLLWVGTGIGFVIAAHLKQQAVIRDAGFVFIGVAVAKAALYDTMALSGNLRVASLAAAGLLLLLGAWVTSRLPALPPTAKPPMPPPPMGPPPSSVINAMRKASGAASATPSTESAS